MSKEHNPDLREIVTIVNGEKYCYLLSINTIRGGGSYLSRVVEARNRTDADKFIFVLPDGADKEKIHARILRTVESLRKAISPAVLPFKVAVSYVNAFK